MADYDLKYAGAQIDGLLDAANELKTNGYIYKGVATPSTNPGTPTERVAYLASEPGTYTNFGGIVIASGLYSLTYVSGTWTGTQMQAGSDIEVVQTTGQSTTDVMSQKAVTDEIDTYTDVDSFRINTHNYAITAAKKYTARTSDKHLWIPCSAGERFRLVGGTGVAVYGFLISDPSTANANVPVSSIYSSDNLPILGIGESVTIFAPADATGLAINSVVAGNNRRPASIQNVTNLKHDISKSNERIDGIISGDGYIYDNIEWIDNYYVNYSTGGVVSSTYYKVSRNLIPIPTGYNFIKTKLFGGTSAVGIAFYDANGVWINGIIGNTDLSKGGYVDAYVYIPSNVKYLRLNAYKNETTMGVQTLSFFARPKSSTVIIPLSFFVNNPVHGYWAAANASFNASNVCVTNRSFIDANINVKIIPNGEYAYRLLRLSAEKDSCIFLRNDGGDASSGQVPSPDAIAVKNVNCGTSWNIQITKIGGGDITDSIDAVLNSFDVEISFVDYCLNNKYKLANPYFETFDSINKDADIISKQTIFGTSIDGCGGALRRIPAVVVTNDNYIIAATEVRSALTDKAQTGIAIARKALSGDTWEYNNILPYNASTYGKVMNPSFVVDRSGAHGVAGRIYLFFIAFPITSSNQGYAYKATTAEMDCAYIYSDDDGATWSSIVSVKSAWDTTEWTWVGVSPANGCQTQDGTLAIPCMGRYGSNWYSAVLVKTPNGNWTFSKRTANYADNESCIFSNVNTIYLNCRFENSGIKRNLYRYDFNSNTLTEICYPYNPNVICQQSISQGTINGNLVYLQSANDPTIYNERNRLTLFASNDGIKWLRVARINDATTYGYSVVDVYNGKVVIVYENLGTISYINLTPIVSIIDATYGAASLNDEDRMQEIVERLL